MQDLIPEKIKNIISQLKIRGYEAYLVGGAVRQMCFDRFKEDKTQINDGIS